VSEVRHDVQDPGRDGDLGVPPIIGTESQAVTNDAFPGQYIIRTPVYGRALL
jgi:hypothetical protein